MKPKPQSIVCPVCGGKGWTERPTRTDDGETEWTRVTCKQCGGSGRIKY